MKKILIAFLIFVIILSVSSCGTQTLYNTVQLILDETDMPAYIGFFDYVFIGIAGECVEQIVEDDFPMMTYNVKVVENLKGELIDDIQIKKNGGFNTKGDTILNKTVKIAEGKENDPLSGREPVKTLGSPLPEEGKQYIFLANATAEGIILIDDILGNTEYTGEEQKAIFIEYIKNQIEYDRQRHTTQYDKNQEKVDE